MKEILKKIYNIFDKQKFAATGVVILIILLNISITLALISHSNKDLDKYVVGIETKLDKNMFKVMLEDSSGGYTESVDNTFPSYDYFFNPTKSGCIDAEGNKLDNSLVFDINTRKVSINVSKTSYCYLYFDMVKEVPSNPNLAQKLITDGNMWQSGLEGDGYRFTGSGNAESSTTPDNFICFGTTDQTECKNNESKYLYRIIGVFQDNEGNEHVKLIKYTPLENLYQWNNANDNTSWNNSSLKAGLNGSYYLTNTVYDYMQNERWSNRIANWTWNAVDTKTNSSSGPDYTLISTQNIYLHEMNRTNKISTIGEWTTAQAKIGLMYASDYQMSLGLSSLSYTGAENTATLKTGWLHQSNNYVSNDEVEWTISKYSGSSYWNNWSLYSSGIIN